MFGVKNKIGWWKRAGIVLLFLMVGVSGIGPVFNAGTTELGVLGVRPVIAETEAEKEAAALKAKKDAQTAAQEKALPTSGFGLDALTNSAFLIMYDLLGMVIKIILSVEGWLITEVTGLVDKVVSHQEYLSNPAVNFGWIAVRDIANTFLIFVLVIIGFGTILNQQDYSYKQLLPRLVIGAILVNFSKVISGIFIDFAQVIMLSFYAAYKGIFVGGFLEMMGLDNIVSFKGEDGSLPVLNSKAELPQFLVMGIIAILFMFAVLVAIVFVAIVYFVRMIMLWFLVAISPLAYVFNLLPATQKYAGQWWDEFTKYLMVGPFLTFFLWLSLLVFKESGKATGQKADLTKSGVTLDSPVLSILAPDNLFNFVVALVMLFAGLAMAQSMAGVASGIMGKVRGAMGKMGVGAITGKWIKPAAQGLGKALKVGWGGLAGVRQGWQAGAGMRGKDSSFLKRVAGVGLGLGGGVVGLLNLKAAYKGSGARDLVQRAKDKVGLAISNNLMDGKKKAEIDDLAHQFKEEGMTGEEAAKRAEKRVSEGFGNDTMTLAYARHAALKGEALNKDTIEATHKFYDKAKMKDDVKAFQSDLIAGGKGNLSAYRQAIGTEKFDETVLPKLKESDFSIKDKQDSDLMIKYLSGLEEDTAHRQFNSMYRTDGERQAMVGALADGKFSGKYKGADFERASDLIGSTGHFALAAQQRDGYVDPKALEANAKGMDSKTATAFIKRQDSTEQEKAAFAAHVQVKDLRTMSAGNLEKSLKEIAKYAPERLTGRNGMQDNPQAASFTEQIAKALDSAATPDVAKASREKVASEGTYAGMSADSANRRKEYNRDRDALEKNKSTMTPARYKDMSDRFNETHGEFEKSVKPSQPQPAVPYDNKKVEKINKLRVEFGGKLGSKLEQKLGININASATEMKASLAGKSFPELYKIKKTISDELTLAINKIQKNGISPKVLNDFVKGAKKMQASNDHGDIVSMVEKVRKAGNKKDKLSTKDITDISKDDEA